MSAESKKKRQARRAAEPPSHIGVVVLDTNYFKNITAPELQALRALGLSVSVTVEALAEVWAQAVRENNSRKLYGPANRVRPWIDERMPIAMGGGHIRNEIEAPTKAERERHALDNRTQGRHTWAKVFEDCANNVLDPEGARLNEGGERLGAEWTRIRNWGRTATMNFDGWSESRVADYFYLQFLRNSHPTTPRHRLHAFDRLSALEAAKSAKRSPRKKAKDNDGIDWAMLLHIARPAFLATWDLDLIDLLRDAATYQAPWVVTLGEMLTDPLPLGNPWGHRAEMRGPLFRRRSRDELNALENEVRARFKAEEARALTYPSNR
jgi:hypothetical protein